MITHRQDLVAISSNAILQEPSAQVVISSKGCCNMIPITQAPFSLKQDKREKTRQMEYKKSSLSMLSMSEQLWSSILHPSFISSVWPNPTYMTPDHSSSLYPSITSVTSSSHFSGPRPELPSPVRDDSIAVDYLAYHEEYTSDICRQRN